VDTPPEGRDPASALPSVAARVAAFVAIFIGAAGGATIGGSFASLQCSGDCDLWIGSSLWIGAIIGAVGVAVIAVLTLRALGEWNTIRSGGSPRLGTRP
jgi:hypothetical protein